MRFLRAALAAAFLLSPPALGVEGTAADTELQEVFDILRKGGNVLVLRHANSPTEQAAPVGMTPDCILQEGRGLDAEGFYQARHIGEWLKKEGVPVLKAYTSDMCRAWDTARLAAGGAGVAAHPAQKTTDATAIAAFKKEVEAELAANPGQNIMLVSHSNIAPFYGAKAEADEEEIPSGAVFVVAPPAWDQLRARFDVRFGPQPQTVTVD